MTVYLVISLPQILYIHRIYMVLANPTYVVAYRGGHKGASSDAAYASNVLQNC